eukprot:380959-Rhodomonas_salina.1
MASLNTAEGKAWEKEHKLIELRQETSTLTLDMVQQVVKLVENHLACINTPSINLADDWTAASALTTNAVAAQPCLEEQ